MRTSRRVAIGGNQLDEVDERIVIQGIYPKAGKDTISTVTPYGGPGGQRITGEHRDNLDLQVSFAIRLKKENAAERSRILEAACGWAAKAAAGAWITTSQKDGRRLWARIVQYPEEGDMREWTNVYTFVFRAYEVPWWQDTTPISVRRGGVTSTTQQISVGGNVKTVLDVSFTNTSGAVCSSITIDTGTAKMSFTGLSLNSGAVFKITHTAAGRLKATAGGSSCLAKRTEGSDDDLWIAPGAPGVKFTADRAGTLDLSCCGRYA